MTVATVKRNRSKPRDAVQGLRGRFWLGVAVSGCYALRFLLGRSRVTGLENLPQDGPALVVLNHVSHVDPVFDAVTVHHAGRLPRFLAKSSLWKVPVLGTVLAALGQIPVERGTARARQSLVAGHQALRDGEVLLIYPEGTITRDPEGWPMPPKVGIAQLALGQAGLDHDVPVIPAARWGTRAIYDHYRKRLRLFPRKEVRLHFGQPLDLRAAREQAREALAYREASKRLDGIEEWTAKIGTQANSDDSSSAGGSSDSPVYSAAGLPNQLLREVSDLALQRVGELLAELRNEPGPAGFYSPERKSGA